MEGVIFLIFWTKNLVAFFKFSRSYRTPLYSCSRPSSRSTVVITHPSLVRARSVFVVSPTSEPDSVSSPTVSRSPRHLCRADPGASLSSGHKVCNRGSSDLEIDDELCCTMASRTLTPASWTSRHRHHAYPCASLSAGCRVRNGGSVVSDVAKP
jgi:hypothetical protein